MNILECDEMSDVVTQALIAVEHLYNISDSQLYRSELESLTAKLEDTIYTLDQVL
jgi:hypothetical protein